MAITLAEAETLAQEHIKNAGEISPGFKYSISKPVNFSNCFYFDYLIIPIDASENTEIPMFGGAPGFIVDKTSGELTVIAHYQLHQLQSEGPGYQQEL